MLTPISQGAHVTGTSEARGRPFWQKCRRLRSLSLFSIKCNMAEPDEPSNDFVEFVIVKRSSSSSFPEAILLYESTNRTFTAQAGFLVSDLREHNGRHLSIITTAGNTVGIKRGKRGDVHRRYTIENYGFQLAVTRTYLPNSST